MINNNTTEVPKQSKKRKISEILASVVDDSEVSMIDTSSRQPVKRRKLNESIERVRKSMAEDSSS